MPRRKRSIGDVALWACVGFVIGVIPTVVLTFARPRPKSDLAEQKLNWLHDLTQWIFTLQPIWWGAPLYFAFYAFGSLARFGSEWLLWGGVLGIVVGFFLNVPVGCLIGTLLACAAIASFKVEQ